MTDDKKKHAAFTRRAFCLLLVKSIVFIFITIRFYYLQYIEGAKYKNLADQNRIRLQFKPAMRGIISDCCGVKLADNKSTHKLILHYSYIRDAQKIITQVNSILGYKTKLSNIDKALAKLPKKTSLVLHDELSWEDIAKIKANLDLEGVEIIASHKRLYPHANLTAHITGYIAKPDKSEAQTLQSSNYYDYQVGKSGIEKYCEEQLKGNPESTTVEVNALGQTVKVISTNDAIPGKTVQLTLDQSIQVTVAEHMQDLYGAVVLLKISDGSILAMNSNPSYDPNRFIDGMDFKGWHDLVSSPGKALINKAISLSYPPGSTFKLVTALAILLSNIDPLEKVVCRGTYQVADSTYRCWNKAGHGAVNLTEAISQSCNVYFYHHGSRAGIANIKKAAHILNLGSMTGIELPYENQGLIPDIMWKQRFTAKRWTIGDTVNASIGQGYVSATPLQLAVALGRIISGKQVVPTLLAEKANRTFESLGVAQEFLALIRAGIFKAFYDPRGTGYSNRLLIPGLKMIGKTGTAQVISSRANNSSSQLKDHSLFIGAFPADNPLYTISVLVENGGWGSQSALPLAKKLVTSIYNSLPK